MTLLKLQPVTKALNIAGGFLSGLLMFVIAWMLVYIYFPVLLGMQAEISQDKNGYVMAHVTGYKVRDCGLIENSFVGFYIRYGVTYETPFSVVDDSSPNSTKPASSRRKSFGYYLWENVPEDADQVFFSVQNECWLDTYPRTSVIGPFPILHGDQITGEAVPE